MDTKVLKHFVEFSMFTNPGIYAQQLKEDFPTDIREIGRLVRKQIIHPATLKHGNIASNEDLKYGDMSKVPWYRRSEDDFLVTVSAILAELYRRDKRGFVEDRAEENRVILSCRYVSLVIAAIFKSKDIPCRVRSGFSPYFDKMGKIASDHWVNQFWNEKERKWITIDVDASLEDYLKFDPYNIPQGTFLFAANSWLDARKGNKLPDYFYNGAGITGLVVTAWELFYDFHCLMNNEITYFAVPKYIWRNFESLSKEDLNEIDSLAELMLDPDNNYDALLTIWNENKKFRILKGLSTKYNV